MGERAVVDAALLAGECGTGGFCPFNVLIAIAWLMSRTERGAWCAPYVEPDGTARFVAQYYRYYSDPLGGRGKFAWSFHDLQLPHVQAFIRRNGLAEIWRARCRGNFGWVVYDVAGGGGINGGR